MPTHVNKAFILAVAMQKGGVGKTTTTTNLAHELHAGHGYRVLVVDLDQQANTTFGLGIDIDDEDPDAIKTLFEALTPNRDQRVPLADVIVPTDWGVDLVPATAAIRELERTGLGAGGEKRLNVELQKIADRYDYILLDCPPALGHLTISALCAATDVLAIVNSRGPNELKGLAALTGSIYEVQDLLNPGIDIRHVLCADHSGQSKFSKAIRRQLETEWEKEYLGVIRSTVRVGEAASNRVPVTTYAPTSTAAEDYRDVTSTLVERIKERGLAE